MIVNHRSVPAPFVWNFEKNVKVSASSLKWKSSITLSQGTHHSNCCHMYTCGPTCGDGWFRVNFPLLYPIFSLGARKRLIENLEPLGSKTLDLETTSFSGPSRRYLRTALQQINNRRFALGPKAATEILSCKTAKNKSKRLSCFVQHVRTQSRSVTSQRTTRSNERMSWRATNHYIWSSLEDGVPLCRLCRKTYSKENVYRRLVQFLIRHVVEQFCVWLLWLSNFMIFI